jgi:putative intracellular protease/amidase
MDVTVLVFNGVTSREVLGPLSVLAERTTVDVRLAGLAKTAYHGFEPLHSFVPDVTLDDIRSTDLLLIPGGRGSVRMMEEPSVTSWLRLQAAQSTFVLSVSTGSLLLAAAGLLEHGDATGHWLAMEVLEGAGAHAVEDAVAWSGNIITTASTVAAADVARTLPERLLFGPATAR